MQVSRTTRNDYDTDGDHDESDTGWTANAPQASTRFVKIDVSDMRVDHPGEAFEVPGEAQKVLDTMEADARKIVFLVLLSSFDSSAEQISIELSTLSGETFALSVDQEVSVQELMAKLRTSRSLSENARVALISQGGKEMNYWDPLKACLDSSANPSS